MKRIMIVDDEVLIRVGIKSMLIWEDYGYTIVGDASNGLDALKKIEQYQPHIILTDLMMGTMDGFELIERCSKEYPNIKFIVLSNYNDLDNVKNAMKLGASDYIFKLTIGPKELIKILDEVSSSIVEQKQQEELANRNQIVIKHLSEIKSKLMKQALNKDYILKASLAEEFKQIPLKSDFSAPYTSLYIKLDDFFIAQKKGNFNEQELLKFSLENITDEIFNKNHPSDVYINDGMDIIVVINRKKEENWEQFLAVITNDFSILVQNIKQYFGLDISGSLSNEFVGLKVLPESVAQNKEIIEESFLLHDGRLHLYKRKTWKNEIILPEDMKLERVDYALAHYDFYSILEYCNSLMLFLGNQKEYRVEAIRTILMQLYHKTKYYLLTVKIDIDDFQDRNGVTLSEAIRGYSCFEYLHKSVIELVHQYKKYYEEKNSISCRNEIERIKSYVLGHMQEEISVQKASELVNMSESHFLHLFKKEVGTSFMDYVNKVRIDRATKLLMETDYRISEIAELVGISNPNYFSVIYKKRTGKSPNECRK
jgi:two-component system response regulator YesN